MHNHRFQVVFTGKYTPGSDKGTVVSNLILMGVPVEKARALVQKGRTVLKRFALPGDAQKMVAKLERAGLVCIIEDSAADETSEGTQGESMLLSLFSKFTPDRKVR